MPRPKPTALLVLAACGTLLAGCVQQPPPGVAIRALNADIVFGVKAKAAAAAPPNFSVTPDEAAAAASDTYDELPPQVFSPAKKPLPKPLQFDNGPAVPVCDDAALNAFPEGDEPRNVPADRSPRIGIYKWKRSGTVTGAGGSVQQISGLEDHELRNLILEPDDPTDPVRRDPTVNSGPTNVAPDPNTPRRQYTWESLEPQIGSDDIADVTYYVDTNPVVNRQVLNPVGDDPPNEGEPERGVVLKSIRYVDKAGNASTTPAFQPATGLLLLPLPVFDGQRFTSVATDPATGQAWQYDAQVVGKDRVDACGTILEGWKVTGTLAVSGGSGGTREYTVIVSTSLGGIVIGQSIKGVDGPNTVDLSFNIGQKTPSPAPAGSQ
ncbi:MAG TPA: hypothetical protein VHN98_07245 [Acidimicrobiales bacterium]|nr:hypothetical protein [Acidimicrobiales bacterium]